MLTPRLPLYLLVAAAILVLPALAWAADKGPLEQAGKPVAGRAAAGKNAGEEKGPLDQANKAAEAKMLDPLVVRMYNCQDLMMGRDYPLSESITPWFECSSVLQQASQTGGGGTGAMFSAASAIGDASALGSMLSPEALILAIQRTIEPESWEDEGGRGKIMNVGALLVVTQTAENQKKIAELLDQFRAARQMVQIEVRWVLLDDAQVAKLAPEGAKRTVPLEVPAAALQAADARVIYRSHLTCLDRQKVHLVTGKVIAYLSDAEPVVAERTAGYDAQISAALMGAIVEVTPALSPDGKSAMIDLRSEVTENSGLRNSTMTASCGSDKGSEPAKVNIELPDVLLQTFRTTLRVPLDKPVLIGGTTAPKAIDGKVLYLLLEISASK